MNEHHDAETPPEPTEQNRAPDLTRKYERGDITVRWYAKRCVHAAECIKKQPRVFNPRRRPWIDLADVDIEDIKRAVEACPTGALEYDGEMAEPEVTARPIAGGPHLLRGDITVLDEDGNVLRHATRVALCRCGKSGNMPFCDNSHRAIKS